MQLINNLVTSILARIQTVRDEREEGQTMVEYGLIVALISIAAIVTIGLVGDELIVVFNKVINGLQGTS